MAAHTSSTSNLGYSNSQPQGPGSLLVSPISYPPDSGPGPLKPVISYPSGLCYRPPPGPGPHHIPPPPPFMPPVYRPDNGHTGMMPPGPPPPNGYPSGLCYRLPPGPGPHHIPPPPPFMPPVYRSDNGHTGMMPPGHPPGPMIPPGTRPPAAYCPPSPHNWCPPPPSHYGPMSPSFGVSGGPPVARPMGPPHTYLHYGLLDHSIPPQHLPPGVDPYLPHGVPRDFPLPGAGPQGQGQDFSSQQATVAAQDSVSSVSILIE